MQQVHDFVENVRYSDGKEEPPRSQQRGRPSEREEPRPGTSGEDRESLRQARETAENLILEAEKFKASIQKPPGMEMRNINTSYEQNDNAFFLITCHIEPSLRSRIERGEFVDLEKLLPKERYSQNRFADETRMEIVTSREGGTFFVPATAREMKINSVRKWEQVFRVYASVYSRANPTRSPEIWQYIHVINLAASSFSWENVSNYDYLFRQLMAEFPNRSWATTYTQGWNLCLREAVNKPSSNWSGGYANAKPSHHDGRDDYCWKFNRGKCNRGHACSWEHRCLYCDAWGHGTHNCRRNPRNRSGGNFRSGDKGRDGRFDDKDRRRQEHNRGSGGNTSNANNNNNKARK